MRNLISYYLVELALKFYCSLNLSIARVFSILRNDVSVAVHKLVLLLINCSCINQRASSSVSTVPVVYRTNR